MQIYIFIESLSAAFGHDGANYPQCRLAGCVCVCVCVCVFLECRSPKSAADDREAVG